MPDRILQRTVEQILAVPASMLVEPLAEVQKFVSQDRIQQRTLEQISDAPERVSIWLVFFLGFVWVLPMFPFFPDFPDFPDFPECRGTPA